jgi:hypothetical protein
MKVSKNIAVAAFTAIVALGGLQLGERYGVTGFPSLVTDAEARVGRPLTPVSVAGVARRTVRRCAVGVYNC